MADGDPVRNDVSGTQAHIPEGGPEPPPPVPPSMPPTAGGEVPAGPPPAPPPAGSPQGWVPRRVVAVVIGSVMAVTAVGLLAIGGAATWLDNTQRDAAGYLTTDPHAFSTPAYAITSDRIELGSTDVVAPSDVLGTVRIRVTAGDRGGAVFVGVAPKGPAEAYLAGVGRSVVTDWTHGSATYRYRAGGAPPTAPADMRIWAASASGTGTRTLTWKPTGGDWLVVVMNEDASRGVAVTADVGATVPPLGWIAVGFLVAGGVLLVAGAILIAVPVVHAGRATARSAGASE